jgi:hypothetical protein
VGVRVDPPEIAIAVVTVRSLRAAGDQPVLLPEIQLRGASRVSSIRIASRAVLAHESLSS